MALKNLIKKQVIIIDHHKRGSGEINNFDNPENDVHIDKKTNFRINGKRQDFRLRIPINSDNPISFKNQRGNDIDIPQKLKKEIRRAFEDTNVRTAFIRDVIETLSDYESKFNSEQQLRQVLERLSRHFDLQWNNETIGRYQNQVLSAYTQFYIDGFGNKFFIKLDKQRITIGENNGYAKQFKEYNP